MASLMGCEGAEDAGSPKELKDNKPETGRGDRGEDWGDGADPGDIERSIRQSIWCGDRRILAQGSGGPDVCLHVGTKRNR